MKQEIDNPGTAGLRKFGFIFGTIIGLLFGLVLPWLLNNPWPAWPWMIAGALWISCVIVPNTLIHVYRPWMKFGLVMGWINTRLILGVMFYMVFFPVGIIMRLLGNDPMTRKLDKSIQSYRKNSTIIEPNHIENPY